MVYYAILSYFEYVLSLFKILVRHKVKEILEMVQDDSRLRDERKRAKKNKDKYVGMSNDLIEDSFYSKYGEFS